MGGSLGNICVLACCWEQAVGIRLYLLFLQLVCSKIELTTLQKLPCFSWTVRCLYQISITLTFALPQAPLTAFGTTIQTAAPFRTYGSTPLASASAHTAFPLHSYYQPKNRFGSNSHRVPPFAHCTENQLAQRSQFRKNTLYISEIVVFQNPTRIKYSAKSASVT